MLLDCAHHSRRLPFDWPNPTVWARACKTALSGLKRGDRALAAVEQAIIVLEDDPCLNAGFGSNLTVNGSVECDAAVMDGSTGDFGSVGAVSGVKNPIAAACAVLEHGRSRDILGRIPPLMLVSQGAREFAERRDVTCVPAEALISERSRQDWDRWKSRLDAAQSQSAPATSTLDSSGLHDIQDTVGAVALDTTSSLAAGVSRQVRPPFCSAYSPPMR
ncbi:hypothetical protein EIP91_011739 [Steccherinum ochraceum]|uniref:Taspase, threonine aspartase, 1 n=1 Tax=Steccherinum ochraceum TaxID=92696 RepID=A0A4R0RR43_9APHY|nr:hypothetical protein EIP91_011739 [Steccherinum ochraceum]